MLILEHGEEKKRNPSQRARNRASPLCCTCNVGHPESLLVLWCFGPVLAPLLAPRGADAAQVDLGGLEEGDGEGLLVLGAVPADQPRQLGVDALSCKHSRLVRGPAAALPAARITQDRAAAWAGSLLGMASTLQRPGQENSQDNLELLPGQGHTPGHGINPPKIWT